MTNDRAWQKQDYYSVYRAHRGLASFKWSHYPFIYDRLLAAHLDAGRPLALLEIGVQNGGSLEIWEKYLPPGSEIHGMDIDPKCRELDFGAHSRIRFHHGSAADADTVSRLFTAQKFDIIVDDGSHISADVIAAFINLFKKLKPAGIYIVEDLSTSFDPSWGGGLYKQDASIEFFKRFADTVNCGYFAADALASVTDLSPFLGGYRQEIASICFYNSVCAITKFASTGKAAFVPILTGETFPVTGETFPVEPFAQREKLMAANNQASIETARAMYTPGEASSRTDPLAERKKLFSRGVEAFHCNCFAEADALFSDLQYRSPEDPEALAWRAFIRARQGNGEEACAFFARAHALAPTRADLGAALGENFLRMGEAALAAEYLREALAIQPDLWMAYPALAQSLFQTGQGEEAAALLESAAHVDSAARDNIRHALVAMLAQRGDLAGLARVCQRFSTGLEDDLLAAHALAHSDPSGEQFVAALEKIQNQLAALAPESFQDGGAPAVKAAGAPIHIAFMTSDIARESRLGRLAALLAHLPGQDFILSLLCGDRCIVDPLGSPATLANLNLFLFDYIVLADKNDGDALRHVHETTPDILIDLDAGAPKDRLALFAHARVPHKLLWGETPWPPLLPASKTLAGTDLGVDSALPCVPLPGLGEVYDFPELPLAAADAPGPRLACLAAANRIGGEGWRLFAEVLATHPEATLLLNLGTLGHEAKDFIRGHFIRAGIAPERLDFVRAESAEELCRLWQSADFGLCPPIDSGGPALPAALWMGRPCLVFDSPLPWSRRAAVLLEAVGAARWIAHDAEEYAALARRLAHAAPAPDPAMRARMKELGLAAPSLFARGFAAAMRDLAREAQTVPQETRP
ncbi:MAG: class I SAM-dependent methyltransferase [Azoarcus sp.]|nr:class I SAM-dependent methyltransferase [Azoarcus sp.]